MNQVSKALSTTRPKRGGWLLFFAPTTREIYRSIPAVFTNGRSIPPVQSPTITELNILYHNPLAMRKGEIENFWDGRGLGETRSEIIGSVVVGWGRVGLTGSRTAGDTIDNNQLAFQ